MKKIIATLLLVLIFVNFAFADDVQIIDVGVEGMVCGSCVQAIKKSFSGEDSVAETDVDLNSDSVRLTLKKDSSITDEKIRELITEAGYKIVEINRSSIIK